MESTRVLLATEGVLPEHVEGKVRDRCGVMKESRTSAQVSQPTINAHPTHSGRRVSGNVLPECIRFLITKGRNHKRETYRNWQEQRHLVNVGTIRIRSSPATKCPQNVCFIRQTNSRSPRMARISFMIYRARRGERDAEPFGWNHRGSPPIRPDSGTIRLVGAAGGVDDPQSVRCERERHIAAFEDASFVYICVSLYLIVC